MINLILLFLTIFSNNTINNDLDIVKNDYNNLLHLYKHQFLIKNDKQLIKSLENRTYIDKKSEPIYIKLLSKLYTQSNQFTKLKELKKRYNIVTDFNYLRIKKIKLFNELPIEYIKKKYLDNTSKQRKIGNYILETSCKFNNKHSIYLYNDLTNKIYINNKEFAGSNFIIGQKEYQKNKVFKISLKINFSKKQKGIIYLKGGSCNNKKSYKNINSNLTVKIINKKKESIDTFEYNFNYTKEEVKELIQEKTPFSYYKLYNFYLTSNLENEAYKYLKLWVENCNNYDSREELIKFHNQYIPSKVNKKNNIKDTVEIYNHTSLQDIPPKDMSIFTKHSQNTIMFFDKNLDTNKILKKEINVVKENNEYMAYTHYLIAIKNASKFIEYFKISSNVDILGVYSIKDNKKYPLATKFTENEIFLKEIKNNIILELFVKSKVENIIFFQERYFSIKEFSINFDKNINFKIINKPKNLKLKNIPAYFTTPFQANLLDFMEYFIIIDTPKEINTLKWYYFYKSLSNLEIPDEMNKLTDTKKAYYSLSRTGESIYSPQEIENKALTFYKWSKEKKLNTKLLIFHLKNDIYGDKLFNYPIIQYKNDYLDLNTPNLSYAKLPKFLKNKEYIEIDEKGRYLYKGPEKILSNFVPNNKVKVNYKILENLDYAEFEINIELYDHYTSGIRAMIKQYPDEEILAKILELYINTKLKNSSLIDYEVKHKSFDKVEIYIKGMIKDPLDYFEIQNTELLKIKNYFSELFTSFFNQSPKLIEYIFNSEIIAPIEIKNSYQEDLELNIELLDKDYQFTQTVDRHRQTVDRHDQTVDRHRQTVDRHGQTVDRHRQTVDRHGQTVDRHGQTVDRHGRAYLQTQNALSYLIKDNKIQIKTSFYLPSGIIQIDKYKDFYKKIKNYTDKKKKLLNNINIKKANTQ